jgi:hypothetical protein
MSNHCKIVKCLLLASFLIEAIAPGVITAQEPKGLDPVLVAKAQAGDANAQYKLAIDYYLGQHGAPRDYEQAAAWARSLMAMSAAIRSVVPWSVIEAHLK